MCHKSRAMKTQQYVMIEGNSIQRSARAQPSRSMWLCRLSLPRPPVQESLHTSLWRSRCKWQPCSTGSRWDLVPKEVSIKLTSWSHSPMQFANEALRELQDCDQRSLDQTPPVEPLHSLGHAMLICWPASAGQIGSWVSLSWLLLFPGNCLAIHPHIRPVSAGLCSAR